MSGRSALPRGTRTAAGRALLRIARRDAARARGRSALICLMIALPVFAMTFADVIGRTAQADPDEEVSRALGAAQYRLSLEGPIGGGLVQAPDPKDGYTATGTAGDSRQAAFADLLPSGAQALETATGGVEIRTEGGIGEVGWTEVAAADPRFAGRYELLDGRAPKAAGEVLATPELLERAGIPVGAPLTVRRPRKTVKVVGSVREVGVRGEEAVYAPPGTLVGAPGGLPAEAVQRSVHVFGAAPVTWKRVIALNALGALVYDRDIVLNPPPRSAVPFYTRTGAEVSSGDDELLIVLAGAVLLALSGLIVVLLAGAAFAVGARRQAHALALVAATGGTARHVRLVVLAGGLVLGAVAAVGGAAAGILTAALARPALENWTDTAFARFDVRPLELVAIGSVALVIGVLAAVLPARAAARQDVVAALAGRRGVLRADRRTPVAGLAILGLGIGAATLGSLWTAARQAGGDLSGNEGPLLAALIAGGAALAVLGLVVLSSSVMGLIARLGARLPLAPRLVVRDAGRHRGRSAPAMSAVLAAVAGSAALLLVVAATDDHDRRNYGPSLPPGTAGVSLQDFRDPMDGGEAEPVLRPAAPVVRAIERHLPVGRNTVVEQLADCVYETGCHAASLVVPPENLCPDEAGGGEVRGDWRCPDAASAPPVVYGSMSGTLVGDAARLERVYAVDDARAGATLTAGGVVAFDRQLIRAGRVTLAVFAPGEQARAEEKGTEPVPQKTVRVKAVHVRGGAAPETGAMLAPALARRLGLRADRGFVLFELERAPTQKEEDAAVQALMGTGSRNALQVERGYESAYGLGLLGLVLAAAVITLGAAGVATGLAQADARADHATLAAVGADPRLRRRLSGLQALLIAGLGTALGVAVGFVPGVALIGALSALELTVPWLPLLILLVVVPLVAGAGAWLFTPARLPLDRRLGV